MVTARSCLKGGRKKSRGNGKRWYMRLTRFLFSRKYDLFLSTGITGTRKHYSAYYLIYSNVYLICVDHKFRLI